MLLSQHMNSYAAVSTLMQRRLRLWVLRLCMVHDTPENRGTWQAHAQLGYYTGRALNHYRCFRVWVQETKSMRISDSLA